MCNKIGVKVQHKESITVSEKVDFPDIRGIIWDLDNTLYRLDEAIIHAFNLSIAKIAREEGVDASMEEVIDMAIRSFEETGYSGTVFIRDHNIDQELLHYNFHKGIDEKVIEKSLETKDLFTDINLSHVLVTHGAYDWAHRVLSHLELLKFFPNNHILALEHYDFERKYESRKGFSMALDRLRLLPEDTLMVEDSMGNLRIPHEMGIKTVYIHHGRIPKDVPEYVDYCFNNVPEMLQGIKTAQISHKKKE